MTVAEAPIELTTGGDARAAVIWLHGLGADGHDFVGLVPELRLAPGVRFVFPHAPFRPVTLNGGYVMRAWYDIDYNDRGVMQDAAHVSESVAAVHALVRRELSRGIPATHIVVAGFSQGGVVALHAGARFPERLAGVMVLSAPVVHIAELIDAASTDSRATPILFAHGTNDGMAPIALAEQAATALRAQGYAVEWRSYPMEHTVSREEVDDIAQWLSQRLGNE